MLWVFLSGLAVLFLGFLCLSIGLRVQFAYTSMLAGNGSRNGLLRASPCQWSRFFRLKLRHLPMHSHPIPRSRGFCRLFGGLARFFPGRPKNRRLSVLWCRLCFSTPKNRRSLTVPPSIPRLAASAAVRRCLAAAGSFHHRKSTVCPFQVKPQLLKKNF